MVPDLPISTPALLICLSSITHSILRSLKTTWTRATLSDRQNVNPYNNSQRARANIYWVWNPTDNFSMGTWATYQFDDQGFTSDQANGNGSVSSASPFSHLFTAGIRPVYWLWGPFAIQGSLRLQLSLEQSSYREPGWLRRGRLAGHLFDRPDHQTQRRLFHPS